MKDIPLVLPEILLLSFACLILVVDLFVRRERKAFTYGCGIGALLVVALSVLLTGPGWGQAPSKVFANLVVLDTVASVLKISLLLAASVALAYSWNYLRKHQLDNGEYIALALFSTLGMMVLASAANLLTAYLGLELLSLSMYAMVALKRDDRVATEAGMKYFVLGALASGLLLFGMSILYGASGSLDLATIATSHDRTHRLALAFGLIFIAAGVAFKLGVVPFHMWVPDVYQGSPTAVTLFLSTAPKLAAFALAYRLFADGVAAAITDWGPVLAVMALISVVLGNIVAIAQNRIKRMLAYSAIANMGFLLLGIVAGGPEGFTAAFFYAVAYVITGLVTFGLITLMSAAGHEFDAIDDLSGLNHKSPWLAFLMLIGMFSLAGIPPTLGFWAKLGVLEALVDAGHVWMAVIAVLSSLIGAFYYLRVVKVMYFNPASDHAVAIPSGGLTGLVSVNALAVLMLGVLPGGLLALCAKAVQTATG